MIGFVPVACAVFMKSAKLVFGASYPPWATLVCQL